MTDAIVLAAGRGTRLKGVAAPFHKVLLPVNGVPMIVNAVTACKNIDGRIIVVAAPENVGAIGQLMEDAEVDITIVVQHTPLGPGDALRRGASASGAERIVIVCADNQLTTRDVAEVVAEPGGIAVGVRIMDDEEAALRFTRITEELDFIENQPGGVWSDGGFRCWVGPIACDRASLIKKLPALDGWTGGEIKIGPYLNGLGPVALHPMKVTDIGVPEAYLHQPLHEIIDGLENTGWQARTILHAMVDLGMITALTCQYEMCPYEDRQLDLVGGKRKTGDARTLSFDHILPRRFGGSDRLENLRIVHRGCNSRYVDRSLPQKTYHRRPETLPRGDDHWTRRAPIV